MLVYNVPAAPSAHEPEYPATPQHGRLMTMPGSIPVNALLNAPIDQPRIENFGRVYYQRWFDTYPRPCDQYELERLDAVHWMIYENALEGRLHLSQLPQGRLRFLDVGYGTGIWSIEMSRRYPNSEHIAIDIGNDHPVSERVDFEVDFRPAIDFTTDAWGVPTMSFDFVHLAQLCGTVPDWLAMYRRAHDVLKPQGVIEHIEFDWEPRCDESGVLAQDSPIAQWWALMQQASARMGKPFALRSDTEHVMRQAGFINVDRRSIRIATGMDDDNGRDDYDNILARWSRFTIVAPNLKTLHGLSMGLLTRYLGMHPADISRLCQDVTNMLNSRGNQVYHVLHIITARKRAG